MKCLTNGSYLFFCGLFFVFVSYEYLYFCLSICTSIHPKASVQFNRSVVSDSLQPHESQHARPPCLSPTPGVHPNSCPSSRWCHPAISSSVIPFCSCPQSLPASESFPMSQLFTWGGQSIGVSASASVLSMNTQDWSPSEWTGWISKSLEKHKYKCWIFILLQFFLITVSYIWITEIKPIIFPSVRKIQYMLLKA